MLEELIKEYGRLDAELKDLKTKHSDLSAKIKTEMRDSQLSSYEADNCKVNYSTYTTQSADEDKMINVLKMHDITKPIKTVEKIDFDVLEDMLYNNTLAQDIVAELNECVTHKTIQKLTVKEV